MSILGRAHPVARKPHRCDYCGDVIPVGQRYFRWVWIDTTASTCRAHIACNDVAADVHRRCGGRQWDGWDVDLDSVTEWVGWVEDPAAALLVLGATWQPGEIERMAALLEVSPR